MRSNRGTPTGSPDKGQTERHQRTDAPLGKRDIVRLLDHLEDALQASECDHSYTFTAAYLTTRNLNTTAVISWLRSYGAGCDREVLDEFEYHWDGDD